jgi:superoxide dismutase
VKQYAHSISSNKYDHLYNDETYKIVENIYDMDLNKDIYQQNIGRKIAAYKTPEEFNSAIKSLYDSVNEFSSKATLAKANVAGIEIVVESEDLVILKIEKFEESKLMGSGSWCISRQETYFNSYTGNERDQYFIFDYTKKAEDNGSMIGITLNNGEYYTAHYKDDEQAEENDDMIQTYINTINDAYIPTYERKANQKNTLSM